MSPATVLRSDARVSPYARTAAVVSWTAAVPCIRATKLPRLVLVVFRSSLPRVELCLRQEVVRRVASSRTFRVEGLLPLGRKDVRTGEVTAMHHITPPSLAIPFRLAVFPTASIFALLATRRVGIANLALPPVSITALVHSSIVRHPYPLL